MTDFDIDRIVEFEIKQIKKNIEESDNEIDMLLLYEQLVDYLELRIIQLKDRIKDISNEVTEY